MQQKFKEIKISKKDSVRDIDDLAVDIGTNITRARLLAGLTQLELAKMMGTTQPSLARYERGSQLPGNRFLLRVADALKTNVVAPTFESIVDNKKSKHSHSYPEDTTRTLHYITSVITDSYTSDRLYSARTSNTQWSTASNAI